ncbi:FHA domain-containing protein [Aquisphaera insulae]|uniref:FHA domain-containing protein n=1 Tax=Aquisphaera insulae TaxID=2712864 RepID=UPI0013EDDBD4|nr:FHA domain-containing protein [Aquisphaera insulae]
MKVQLVVVRGKPEGKVIPLAGPKFKIGRGETCHLRPTSEQVSREHAEFELQGDTLTVRDLGSRNGTLVNGKALTSGACALHDRDLVQVGPLTFAVAIQETKPAAKPAPTAAAAKPAKPASPDDISTDDIDSWLLGDRSGDSADQATAVYGGDTITIAAFKDAQVPPPAPSKSAVAAATNRPPSVADDSEYERQSEAVDEAAEEEPEEEQPEADEEAPEEAEEEAAESNPEEEFVDPSNPFYVAKKAQKDKDKEPAKTSTTGAANQTFKDSSDAANEILRKLMERRRASKS